MSTDPHFYEPALGHGLAHDPISAIIGPRPIGWISSRGKNGSVNLAPYSFFNMFNYYPPIIGFASVGANAGAVWVQLVRASVVFRFPTHT